MLDHWSERGAGVLIDCDTCTVRGEGCADCVVSVLLGAPPGWQDGGRPTVVPLTRRPRGDGRTRAAGSGAAAATGTAHGGGTAGPVEAGTDTPHAPDRAGHSCEVGHVDSDAVISRPVVELDDVERRAVRALADFGLVPPLRHQDAAVGAVTDGTGGKRHVS